MHVDFLRKNNQHGDLDEIQLLSYISCCQSMEQHILAGIVAFGQRPEETHRNKSCDVFIRVENGAQIVADEGQAPKEGGSVDGYLKREPKPNTDIALAYCPWCTKPVEAHEIKL
jgi:hypothetical protein